MKQKKTNKKHKASAAITNIQVKGLVWFICLMTYQLPMGYSMPKLDLFVWL